MSAMQKEPPEWVHEFEANLETIVRWSESWGRQHIETVLKSLCRTAALVDAAGLATSSLKLKCDYAAAILTNRLIGYVKEDE